MKSFSNIVIHQFLLWWHTKFWRIIAVQCMWLWHYSFCSIALFFPTSWHIMSPLCELIFKLWIWKQIQILSQMWLPALPPYALLELDCIQKHSTATLHLDISSITKKFLRFDMGQLKQNLLVGTDSLWPSQSIISLAWVPEFSPLFSCYFPLFKL